MKRGMQRIGIIGVSLLAPLVIDAASVQPSWDLPPSQQTEGVFWQEHWYQREQQEGGTRRARMNSAESVIGEFGDRKEARENGLLLINAPEDLFLVTGAELYTELWGGHPGTANKRVTINGRSTYQTPRVGTEDGHCTFSYPVIKLAVTDLVNGQNAIQWTIEQGTTFWGHSMVDQACLRFSLTNGHPRLVENELDNFEARLLARPFQTATDEGINLVLDAAEEFKDRVDSITFQGWYFGYDDNGDLRQRDWHGFTLDRVPGGYLGTVSEGVLAMNWDTHMLPAQKSVAARAFVRFKDVPGLVYMTPAVGNLVVPDRKNAVVHLYEPSDTPIPFWSRANNKKSCTITLDVDSAQIEEAHLYVTSWTGGPGGIEDYFTINGVHHPVAEGHDHTRQFNRMPVDPKILRKGVNTIELLSDTTHHGIEIIHPGPALMIRAKR